MCLICSEETTFNIGTIDQYASEIYYSGDHYSIVSGCNLFLVDSISNLSDGRKRIAKKNSMIVFLNQKKASYLLLRKTFDDLYELIEKGNQSRKANVEDIIHAQKAVAKVSIGRSKENADALMNSNDHIMEKDFDVRGCFIRQCFASGTGN